MENNTDQRAITVYPSTVIPIECPYCKVKGKIKREYPPEKKFTIICPNCKKHITININTRLFYRKDIHLEAYYQMKGTKSPAKKCEILDMSRMGLSLKCHKIEPIHKKTGGVMLLKLALPPRKESIKVSCEVVRTIEETDKTITLGLKFIDLGEYEETQIGFFLLP
ncbi:PilZ domain-containing protein [Candidatus Magnetominusculus xianensis]|uniref:PilZ domain-containing protein n=1 Tax=Candidatus Magnetominusculus xianensis TaxID=1748249 RepID=A0ABR5SII8_9BACT|nr:PilZ domain-containing protein [Candidatus Magnetominusculus xianensis]KWT92716.1 hypothetical protein ASN18_0547 [Candidatus Magnetominusculus xianensis]MBF0403733.1 PilZ domain-containing protein [Nitrospirota bacterium]